MAEKSTAEPRILALLQHYPKGASTSDIAAEIGLNRNTTAKILGLLEAQGRVESATYGTAHVFRLAHRAPVGVLLDHTSAMICTIDQKDRVSFANDPFLRFFGLSPEDHASRPLGEMHPNPTVDPPFASLFDGREDRGARERELSVRIGPGTVRLKMRWVPTVMEDLSHGTTFIIEDITEAEEHMKNMEFLARTSAALADMGEEENIYQFIADRIAELAPECIVVVNSVDMEKDSGVLAAYAGDPELVTEYAALTRGVWDKSTVQSLQGAPEAIPFLRKGVLMEGPDRMYVEVYRQLPEEFCDQVDARLGLGRFYFMGCVCRGGLFGNVGIRLKKGSELRNQLTIEAFIRQAGVALQRRHLREKLRRAEERIQELESELQKISLPKN